MQPILIFSVFALIVLATLWVSPRQVSVSAFFKGQGALGQAPSLWTLVLSQVTTWIFARSLMNAAILGYYYGIAGVLAYAAYYGSFLTGGFIVGRLRRQGAGSVQEWLTSQYGALGTACYNLVIGLRLLSEVFANLIVVGLIFRAVLPEYAVSANIVVVSFGLLALAYSAWGGMAAALRTDVVQMVFFLVVFGAAFVSLILMPDFDLSKVLTAEGVAGAHNGWVLLGVAALQVFSYPVHDPVMMDRGFVSDDTTTRKSFLHAFWISTLCIVTFGFFGIQASLQNLAYDTQLIGTWSGMFPTWVFAALMISLLVSALSTLDSALSSAARLVVEELGLAPHSLKGGRMSMLVFACLGAVLTLWGNQSLFDAVAVSGTASMFLTPVILVGLIWQRRIALWAYCTSFAAALIGAGMYFFRDHESVATVLYDGHKYEQLLQICVVVLLIGFSAVAVGSSKPRAVSA